MQKNFKEVEDRSQHLFMFQEIYEGGRVAQKTAKIRCDDLSVRRNDLARHQNRVQSVPPANHINRKIRACWPMHKTRNKESVLTSHFPQCHNSPPWSTWTRTWRFVVHTDSSTPLGFGWESRIHRLAKRETQTPVTVSCIGWAVVSVSIVMSAHRCHR